MKTSSLRSRKLLVWETQSTRLFLLFNIIQQSSRYSSQSEAGWWCLKHLFFRFNRTMIFGTQESCSNLFDEIIQPEDTQFLGPRKGEVHLGPPVGFQDSKKFQPFFFGILESVTQWDSKIPSCCFFWIMCRHTLFTTLKRFKQCLAGSLIEAERLDKYTSDSLDFVGR